MTVASDVAGLAPVHFWAISASGTAEPDTGSGTHVSEFLDGAVTQYQLDDAALGSYLIFAEGPSSGSCGSAPAAAATETFVAFAKVYSDTISSGLGADLLLVGEVGATTYRRLGLTTDGKPFATVDGTTVTGGSALAEGWHMMALYVDSTGGTIRLRVDGADVGSASATPTAHASPFDWAWHGNAFTNQAHLGMSSLGYWTSLLTDAQTDAVWDNYVAASAPPPPVATIGTRLSWDGGLQFGTDGSADWEPPVDPPPATLSQGERVIVAQVIDSVTISGTEAFPEISTAQTPRARHRVVIGGKDVTYFRGIETPMPSYGLVSPLLYGSGQISFPQIHAAYERPGYGAISWLKKFAPVKIQRVDPETGAVLATDYRGFIADFIHDGRNLSCTLGGQATGRAAMADRPVPIFPDVVDIGQQAIMAIRLHLRLPVANMPATGIRTAETGGGSQLDFLTDLLAKSTTADGEQWTVMPNTAGAYRMFKKDTATIAATVYIDGFRVVESLTRDFTEEPNRVWATAVAPGGMRIRFGTYPGLTSGGRPAFSGTLHPGDTGAGVTAIKWRLWVMGYIDGVQPPADWTTDADDPVTQAVEDLQDDAGLSVTGNVNEDTWNAAFDHDVTGYSLRASRIAPAAQKSYTKSSLYTASGQVIRPNPAYDRSRPFVDVSVDMGAGFTRRQVQKWAKHELAPESNWVGTITVNTGAVIDGEHSPALGPLSEADVRDVRTIKPGQNLWLPSWDGGTLVHVSGVTVNPDSVEFAVDTRARDTMKVWQVITRNRESRRNPARQWIAENRSSRLSRDSMTGWDEIGGLVDDRVTCPANQWTVFPVVAGEQGQVRKIHIQTADAAARFGAAVFGKKITGTRLDNMIGDPLSVDGTKAWHHKAKTLNDDHWLLWSTGTHDQPAGYWPEEIDRSTTPATVPDVTGEHVDPMTWPYFCVGAPVMWVAIHPDRDTHILPGRIMWVQLDDQAG